MAKRRMISKQITESDGFYNLTPSAQTLYLHLVMNADDDGFVDKWKSVMHSLFIRRTHFKSLIEEGYVLLFDDDVLLITDWLIHNKIRLDRYSEGRYSNRLDTLIIQPNGRYTKPSEDFLAQQDKKTEDK